MQLIVIGQINIIVHVIIGDICSISQRLRIRIRSCIELFSDLSLNVPDRLLAFLFLFVLFLLLVLCFLLFFQFLLFLRLFLLLQFFLTLQLILTLLLLLLFAAFFLFFAALLFLRFRDRIVGIVFGAGAFDTAVPRFMLMAAHIFVTTQEISIAKTSLHIRHRIIPCCINMIPFAIDLNDIPCMSTV